MRPLRVLHVNAGGRAGGAARAAWRIHEALGTAGVASRFLLQDGSGDVAMPQGPVRRFAGRLALAVDDHAARCQVTPSRPGMRTFNWLPSGLGRWLDASDHDLIHFHWLGNEMLSLGEMAAIHKPVCWTLHDMWAFLGAEHYDDLAAPGRYQAGYDRAPRPAGDRGPDLDAWAWRRKRRAWAGARFHLASPSRWLAECARASALFNGRDCAVIPNCVDTARFRPRPRAEARAQLGLPPDRHYILFGAQSGTGDPRKGFHQLREALGRLALRDDLPPATELLVFGRMDPGGPALPLPAHALGVIDDDERLACLYAAADVFAAPSLQDNLPNTVVEALACGTPCVAFDIGGMPDLVRHGATGWLARPFEVDDFAAGLAWALRQDIGAACRAEAARRHAPDHVAAQYAQWYERVLAGGA